MYHSYANFNRILRGPKPPLCLNPIAVSDQTDDQDLSHETATPWSPLMKFTLGDPSEWDRLYSDLHARKDPEHGSSPVPIQGDSPESRSYTDHTETPPESGSHSLPNDFHSSLSMRLVPGEAHLGLRLQGHTDPPNLQDPYNVEHIESLDSNASPTDHEMEEEGSRCHKRKRPRAKRVAKAATKVAATTVTSMKAAIKTSVTSVTVAIKAIANVTNNVKTSRKPRGKKTPSEPLGPIQCNFLGCHEISSTFSRPWNFQKHVEKHRPATEKRFVCPEAGCDSSFWHNNGLKRHASSHSKEKPFECSICAYRSGRKDNFRSHMRRMHPPKAVK